jgi:hypothetical protein
MPCHEVGFAIDVQPRLSYSRHRIWTTAHRHIDPLKLNENDEQPHALTVVVQASWGMWHTIADSNLAIAKKTS